MKSVESYLTMAVAQCCHGVASQLDVRGTAAFTEEAEGDPELYDEAEAPELLDEADDLVG